MNVPLRAAQKRKTREKLICCLKCSNLLPLRAFQQKSKHQQTNLLRKILKLLAPQATTKENPNILIKKNHPGSLSVFSDSLRTPFLVVEVVRFSDAVWTQSEQREPGETQRACLDCNAHNTYINLHITHT